MGILSFARLLYLSEDGGGEAGPAEVFGRTVSRDHGRTKAKIGLKLPKAERTCSAYRCWSRHGTSAKKGKKYLRNKINRENI